MSQTRLVANNTHFPTTADNVRFVEPDETQHLNSEHPSFVIFFFQISVQKLGTQNVILLLTFKLQHFAFSKYYISLFVLLTIF